MSKTDKIMKLALQRSIFYPAVEIYSDAPSGFWEYGPYGATIRRKLINFWRKELVQKEGFLEIHGAQVMPKSVFESSGHLNNFVDPLVQCKKCHALLRADKLLEEKLNEPFAEGAPTDHIDEMLKKHKITCTECNSLEFGKVKRFNMMIRTDIGPTHEIEAYLRPEACQSIFLDYPRLSKTMRRKLPLGIAQAGPAFRNEISPRNALIRLRELAQMDIEIFFDPKEINEHTNWNSIKNVKINTYRQKDKKMTPRTADDLVQKKYCSGKFVAYYLAKVQQFYESLGIPSENIQFRELDDDERAFYAKETWDIEIMTYLGWQEVMAVNYRTDYDLKAHGKGTKKEYTEKREDGTSFVPHILELSAGIDRAFYCVYDNSYREDDKRNWLALKPKLTPFDVAILPLMKKEQLVKKAKQVAKQLEEMGLDVFYDQTGSIGKRYARNDEIGIPNAVTIDFETLGEEDKKLKDTVTIRNRDTTKQKRIPISELAETIYKLKNQ